MSKKQITLLVALFAAANMSQISAATGGRSEKIENSKSKKYFYYRAALSTTVLLIALTLAGTVYPAVHKNFIDKKWTYNTFTTSLESHFGKLLSVLGAIIFGFLMPKLEDAICGCNSKEKEEE